MRRQQTVESIPIINGLFQGIDSTVYLGIIGIDYSKGLIPENTVPIIGIDSTVWD
jgi:hypothetical protein